MLIARQPDGSRLTLSGRLDAGALPDVREALGLALAAGSGDLVVDLSEAEVVNGSGLGLLLMAHRNALRAGRRLVVSGLSDSTRRLLVRTRLDRVLHVEPPAPWEPEPSQRLAPAS